MHVSVDFAVTVLVRWIGLVALAAIVGGLAVGVVVLPADVPVLERRLASWTRAFTLVLLVASAAELLLRARTMAAGDLAAALAVAPAVLTRTHFGTVWSIRAAALVVLLGLAGRRERAARWAACAVSLVVALTTTLTGHAADRGDLSLNALIDWLHVAAAATWTGGLFWLASLVLGEARSWPRERLVILLRRFSRLAAWCLAAVVTSGIYNATVQLGSLGALWTTAYGSILVVKVMFVIAVASLGAANRFTVLPELGVGPAARIARRTPRAASPARPPAERLTAYVAREAALALVVLGCTALLGESPPPHHQHADIPRPQAIVSRLASATNRAHDSAHVLHTAWVSACLRHSFSQSSQMSRQAVANSPRRVAPSAASSATAEQAGVIWATLWAQAASEASPLLNIPRQCARHAWPSATQARAASRIA